MSIATWFLFGLSCGIAIGATGTWLVMACDWGRK